MHDLTSFPETCDLSYARIEFHANYMIETPKPGACINLASVHDLSMLKVERYGDRPIPFIFDNVNDSRVDINVSLYADHSSQCYGFSAIIVVAKNYSGSARHQAPHILIKRTPFLVCASRDEAIALAERLQETAPERETEVQTESIGSA